MAFDPKQTLNDAIKSGLDGVEENNVQRIICYLLSQASVGGATLSAGSITSLPAATSANLTDLLVKVNDPGGTPTTETVTLAQVQLVMRDILMALDEVGITLTETVGTTADAIVYLDDNGIPLFRLRFNGALTSSGSIESTAASAVGGFVLKSPDSTRWRITVNNLGSLSAVLA